MKTDVSIRCSCGALGGIARGLSADAGNRTVCYCPSCQLFQHVLGRADEVLDANGGTEIFQTSAATVEFTEGAEQLACIRLTARGPLRWHTACCNSPIGNTSGSSAMPFVGLIHSCLDHAADGRSSDAALGPIRNRVFARYAKGDLGEIDASQTTSLSMIFRLLPMILRARLRGDHRRSPFFDPATGEPHATPRLLSDAELRNAEAARDAS